MRAEISDKRLLRDNDLDPTKALKPREVMAASQSFSKFTNHRWGDDHAPEQLR